jgi:hypothetical protein
MIMKRFERKCAGWVFRWTLVVLFGNLRIFGGEEPSFTVESKIWFESVRNGRAEHQPQHDRTIMVTVTPDSYLILK